MEKKDSLRTLKYIGYCLSSLPPEEVETSYDDFIQYCKFQLCKINHKLMMDPVWGEYSDEEIISEYFAHNFSSSKELREKFEVELRGGDSKIYDWLDEMIEQNQSELEKKSKELDSGFDFVPPALGE